MKKVFKFFLLNNEAYLFDSKLFIFKSLLAVSAAYAIVQQLPLVHKDLISVLFGLMMTLEPVTVTGIRSGLKQITATLIGALVTATIILVFGINLWTVAFSVSATLFICLKINWREVSPVAIFTSIYMTNYIQYTTNGEPSIALTFLLRILSLGIGILVAVIFNFLFSLFFYKQMESKRIAHSLFDLADHLKQIKKGIEVPSLQPINLVKERLPESFKGIEWLISLVNDKDKEAKIKMKFMLHKGYGKIASYHKTLMAIKNMAHLIYDTTYFLSNHLQDFNNQQLLSITTKLDELIKECEYLGTHFGNHVSKYSVQINYNQSKNQGLILQEHRIIDNLINMKEMLDIINDTFFETE